MSQKRCAIYARVSSEKQARDDKVSIGEQLKACRELASREGFTIAHEFIDNRRYRSKAGRLVEPSAKRLDRPALTELLERVGRDFTIVLAWHQDRLCRGGAATEFVRDRLEAARADVRLSIGTWDPETVELLGAVSGMELRRIRQRMMLGKKGRVQEGLHIGEAPYGYKAVRNDEGRNIGFALVPGELPALKEMARLYLERLPIIEVARRLGDNPRTGKRWLSSTVHYCLSNPFYYGRILYGRHRPQGEAWEAKAVHPLAWDKATLAALERERSRRHELYRRGPRRSKHLHLFAGVLRCAVCGRPMASMTQMQQGHVYLNYRCNTRMYELIGLTDLPRHAPNHISEIKLLAQFRDLVGSLTADELAAELASLQLPERDDDARARSAQQQANLRAKAQDLEVGLAQLSEVPAAAAAVQAEIIRVKRELESLEGDAAGPAPLSFEEWLARATQLQAAILDGETPHAVLKAIITANVGMLYVVDGKISVGSSVQSLPKR